MAITCRQLIEEVQGLLQSFSLDESQSTTLGVNMSASDVTGMVTSVRGIATGISPGVIELDQELIYCDQVNADGSFTIPAWGRGYLGTVATSHKAGTRLVSQPTFPRYWTLQAINETLFRVFPDLFAVGSTELTTTTPQITYQLPDEAQWVLGAKWQKPDGRRYWQSVMRWRMSPGGGTNFGDNGITVDVADTMMPGRPIQFLYAAMPGQFTNESDDYETTTGLYLGTRDVIVYGAAAALTTSQELSRLQMSSVEQQNRASLVAPSAALTSSRFLDQKFQQRLMEERKALQRLYPPRVTRAWI